MLLDQLLFSELEDMKHKRKGKCKRSYFTNEQSFMVKAS